MSLPSRFNKDLRRRLRELLPAYEWKEEFRIGERSRERVDVAGFTPAAKETRRRSIFIEVELRREDPASNILKVWSCLEEGDYPAGVIFVQGFSKVFRAPKYHARGVRYETAKRFGQFVQRVSRRKFLYLYVDIPYYPRAGSNEGDGARRRWARWLAQQIAKELCKVNAKKKAA